MCSKLPSNSAGLTQSDQTELQNILLFLTTVVKNEKLEQDEIMLVRTTYQLSMSLSLLVKEMKIILNSRESSIDKYSSEDDIGSSPSSSSTDVSDRSEIVFNVVTQDMMNKNKKNNKSYRGHRLPKQNVRFLERWYVQNFDNPYLDEKSIEYLIIKTGLSKIQVKNWVSNRRRKEKSITISPEISQLLKESTKEIV